jgi:pantoate--beta-alanine ligase
METIRTVSWMKESSRLARAENKIVGLVPTMGALHAGHMSLVERAKRECTQVVTSIFVNPTQFGPKEDLAKYPRTFESDAQKLEAAGVDAIFAPQPADIYPPNFRTYVNVENLSDRLEGRSRPGHFRGVATVVLKLFEIVQPTYAYFGRKDAQQVRIISQMVRDLNLDVEIVICPIVREPDGLALSSRNVYLTPDERKSALVLNRALTAARDELASGTRDTLQLQSTIQKIFAAEPLASLDYAEIVDADTFDPITRISKPTYILLAATIGKTRLIDNLFIEPNPRSSDTFTFHL